MYCGSSAKGGPVKAEFAEYLVTTARVGRERIETIPRDERRSTEPLGRLAMLHGLLSGADVEEILRHRHIDDRLFGQTALRLGMMTQDQLDVLLRGQSIRACLELVEDLALAGALEFKSGLEAITEFVSNRDFATVSATPVAGQS